MSKVIKPEFIFNDLAEPDLSQEPISFPFKIEAIVPNASRSSTFADYIQQIEKIIRKIVPQKLLLTSQAHFAEKLLEQLPIVSWTDSAYPPDTMSIYVLCLATKEDKFESTITDVINQWLIPGKTPQILFRQSLQFQWDLFKGREFFFLEIKVLVEDGRDLGAIQQSLSSLSMDIASCIKEKHFTDYLLKTRSLSSDQKLAYVHQELIYLLQKYPKRLDPALFSELSRFLAIVSPTFLEPRNHRLISRIVTSHFLMKSDILRLVNLFPESRHLAIRYVKTKLQYRFGSKPVLGLICAVSLLDKHDFLEETHIVQAGQAIISGIQAVKGSFYSFQGLEDPIRLLYIELEKKGGSPFTIEEQKTLMNELEEELKRRVETLVPSIFMIRNEEEIMRNILILSQELHYLSDIPQVMISLDRQTASELYFTLIVVRLQRQGQQSLQKRFESLQTPLRFIPDRVQQVGFLRKNYPKEANVFHLCLPKDVALLRADFSVNFYLARQKVASILAEAIGPFRDYNGGMILKQSELFSQFKDSFEAVSQKNHELLENFFFSLNPIESQATLPLYSIQHLFELFLDATKVHLQKKDQYFLKIEEKKEQLFALVRTQEGSFKEELLSVLSDLELSSKGLIHTHVSFQGSYFSALILQSPEPKRQQQFIEGIHQAIHQWKTRIKHQQILRLSFFDIPRSFDPRLSGDQISCTLVKMLFEGLTRLDKRGKPELALAQTVEISSDLKNYLFSLKKCYWSNGSPITAYDFEYAWKKILSSDFLTSFAYFFYPIKNAKGAHEGHCDIEEVGIKALDAERLLVQLEHPTPEFLELTAHTLYSPVMHNIDKTHPNWASGGEDTFICNGPFTIKKASPNLRCELVKNHRYWDKDSVRLEQIIISKDNSYIANEMFKNDETDWLGQPLRAWEPFFGENKEKQISSTPTGIYWCVFNVESFPFNHVKLRQAFSYAINRQELIDHLSYDGVPASTPLPLSHTMNHDPREVLGNIDKAKQLFDEALDELGLLRTSFPPVTLIHSNSEIRKSSAMYLAQQWQKVFNISCVVIGYEFHTLLNKMVKGDFQLGTLFWKSWIDNPIYTLNSFKQLNHQTNFAKWSNQEFSQLLDRAQEEVDPIMRIKYLSEAEKILIREKPVFSIFYERERNIKKPHLKNVFYSQTTGYVDFKNAYIER